MRRGLPFGLAVVAATGTHVQGDEDLARQLANPTAGGVTWGAGTASLAPTTGSSSQPSAKKWGVGPTGFASWQQGSWTYGLLGNHIGSFAGESSRADVSSSLVQPFVSYTTKDAWTYGVNAETNYDWKAKSWSVPVNLTVSKLSKVGDQRVSLGVGARWWADSPDNGPHGWGVRFVVTFLFPSWT